MNNTSPQIKFDVDIKLMEINFLDLKLIKMSNKLATDLYIKPTGISALSFKSSSAHEA